MGGGGGGGGSVWSIQSLVYFQFVEAINDAFEVQLFRALLLDHIADTDR